MATREPPSEPALVSPSGEAHTVVGHPEAPLALDAPRAPDGHARHQRDAPSDNAALAATSLGHGTLRPAAGAGPLPAGALPAGAHTDHADSNADTVAPSAATQGPAGHPNAAPGAPQERIRPASTDRPERARAFGEVPVRTYRLGPEIARGGMGRILHAHDERLDRDVAIKELLAPSDDFIERFAREALITARLQHPGIVPVYEAGTWPDGKPFFAMKRVAGRPFDRIIAETTEFASRLALLPTVAAAADAIAYAHANHVVHRDLKPGNILVGDFGETVVIDWGLAKDLHSDTASVPPAGQRRAAIAASPTSMAPHASHHTPTPVSASAVRTKREAPPAAGAAPDAGPGSAPGASPSRWRTRPGRASSQLDAGEAATEMALPSRSSPAPSVAAAGDAAPHAASRAASDRATDAALTSALTVAGAVMGTPAYMAPEQARGEAVDERADVFALGAMLYHVLCGRHAYDVATSAEAIIAAAEGAIVPLRTREPRVPADLVTIVQRAMALDPNARYPSAREFSAQLRRFLTGQLVEAHRYTAAERAKKFFNKHRAAFLIGAIALVSFLIGGTLAVQRIVAARAKAEAQRAIALTRKQAAETLVDFMVSDLRQRLVPMGRLDLIGGLGRHVRAYYDAIARTPGGLSPDDVERMAVALSLTAQAEVQAGDLQAALATWQQAQANLTATASPTAPDPHGARRRFLARAALEIAAIDYARGNTTEAKATYAQTIAALEILRAAQPTHRETLLLLADGHDRLGDLLRNHSDIDGAFAHFQAAYTARQNAVSDGGSDREAIFALSKSHLKLGTIHFARGASTAALAAFRACQRLRESLLETDPDNVEWLFGQVEVLNQVGDMQRDMGQLKPAIQSYSEAVPIIDQLLRRDASNITWRRQRGNLLADLGFAQLEAGDPSAALSRLTLALENHRDLTTRDPENPSWQNDVSRYRLRLGDALLQLNRRDEAIAAYEEARSLRAQLVARDPQNIPWRRSLAWANAKLGGVFAKAEPSRARTYHSAAYDLRRALYEASPNHAGLRNELASSQLALARLLATSDRAAATQLANAAVAHARALVTADPDNNEWRETLVSSLISRGTLARTERDETAARTAFEDALTVANVAMRQAPQSAWWPTYVAELHLLLADLHNAAARPQEAAEHRHHAQTILEKLAKTGTLPASRRNLLQQATALK